MIEVLTMVGKEKVVSEVVRFAIYFKDGADRIF